MYPAVRTYWARFAPLAARAYTAPFVAATFVLALSLVGTHKMPNRGWDCFPSGRGGTVVALVSECWSLPFAIARPSAESSHQLGGWDYPDFWSALRNLSLLPL